MLSNYALVGGRDGAGPFGTLVADSQGNLFGTTVSGGAGGLGTVFELPAGAGAPVTLHSFEGGSLDGANPYGGLVVDSAGNIFGTTFAGGKFGMGTVFEIPAGATDPTILYSFSGPDGAEPYAALVRDGTGNLFGTTSAGGAGGDGTVFEIPAGGGTLTILHSFSGAGDGMTPFGALLDVNGVLYGTTSAGGGGGSGRGTVFRIAGGIFTTIHTFTGMPDGAQPTGKLVMDAQGKLFGTTSAGGANDAGTIFSIPATGGTLTTLYSFSGGVDGSSPFAGLTYDNAGNLFGTTYHGGARGQGTVFEIPAGAAAPNTLISFGGGADGATPYGAVVIGAGGGIFGTTNGGGGGSGTIFELSPTQTTQISVRQQPGTVTAGVAMKPSLVVDLKLAGGGIDTADVSDVTLSIVAGPAGGTLTGTTTVRAANGVATFGNLKLTQAGTYTLMAADGSLPAVALGQIVVQPGTPSRLVFGQQPAGIVAGQTMAPGVVVYVEDALGNIVTSDSSMVTLKIASGPKGATFGSGGAGGVSVSVQAVGGKATFASLTLTQAGTYAFSVVDGKLPAIKSQSFAVSPDAASSQLKAVILPVPNIVVGKALSPDLVIDVVDQFGNLITTDHSPATINIVTGPIGGTLVGTATVNAAGGVLTFRNLSLPVAGNYQLQVLDTTLAIPTPLTITETISRGVTSVGGLPGKTTRTFGQSLNLTAKFKSTAPTSIPFTGVATIVDNASNVMGTATMTAAGVAKFSVADLAPGAHVLTVTYAGDADHLAAFSSPFTVNVNQASTRTTLISSTKTPVAGQTLVLTAQVASTSAPDLARTGTVNFYDGPTLIGSAVLDAGSMANLTLNNLPAGKHAFKAVYVGDVDFKGSASAGLVRTAK